MSVSLKPREDDDAEQVAQVEGFCSGIKTTVDRDGFLGGEEL